MLYQEIKSLKLHWDMFRGALQRWREEDEGVTTLEMVIIGGFLIVAAGALVTAFSGIWSTHRSQLNGPGVITPT
jgi:hypothetical protein